MYGGNEYYSYDEWGNPCPSGSGHPESSSFSFQNATSYAGQRNPGPDGGYSRPRPQAFRGSNQNVSLPPPRQQQASSSSQNYDGFYSDSYYQHHPQAYHYSQIHSFTSSSYSYNGLHQTPSTSSYNYNDIYYYPNNYMYANSQVNSHNYYPPASATTVSDTDTSSYSCKSSESEKEKTSSSTKTCEVSDNDFDLEDVEEVDFSKQLQSTPKQKKSKSVSFAPNLESASPNPQNSEDSSSVSKPPQICVPEPKRPLNEILKSPLNPPKPAPKSALLSIALKNKNAKRKRPSSEAGDEDELTQLLGKSKYRASGRTYAARPSTTKQQDEDSKLDITEKSAIIETDGIQVTAEAQKQPPLEPVSPSVNNERTEMVSQLQTQIQTEVVSQCSTKKRPPPPPPSLSHLFPEHSNKPSMCSDSANHVPTQSLVIGNDDESPEESVFDIRIRKDIFENEDNDNDELLFPQDSEDEELDIL